MNKFGRRILAALITSSLVVTPVLAAPSSKLTSVTASEYCK